MRKVHLEDCKRVLTVCFCSNREFNRCFLVVLGLVSLVCQPVYSQRHFTSIDRKFPQGHYFGGIWCAYRSIQTIGSFTHQWDVRLRDLAGVLHVCLIYRDRRLEITQQIAKYFTRYTTSVLTSVRFHYVSGRQLFL